MNLTIKDHKITGYINGTSNESVPAPTGFNVEDMDNWAFVEDKLTQDPSYDKSLAAQRIKREAANMLSNLTWRVERARERDAIGASGESINDVLREREAVRIASNRAEHEVNTLLSISEVRNFQWSLKPEDFPVSSVVTRLGFMRRFTDAERAAIRTARDSGQSQDLLDFWELLQLATNVNLNDADIKLGVNMLETNGLIGAGRATEILTI